MDFEGQTDQLGTLCGEMESLGVENFNDLIVGKCRLQSKEIELWIRNRWRRNWAAVQALRSYEIVSRASQNLTEHFVSGFKFLKHL